VRLKSSRTLEQIADVFSFVKDSSQAILEVQAKAAVKLHLCAITQTTLRLYANGLLFLQVIYQCFFGGAPSGPG